MKNSANITDIAKIRSVLRQRYQKYNERTPFTKALELALLEETRSASAFSYPQYPHFLSYTEFWDYIGSLPVFKLPPKKRASKSAKYPKFVGNFYIEEQSLFQENMDINIYTHLPFVNDGIHTHDHFELNYIYHGEGSFEFENQRQILPEGALLIIAPDSPHNITASDGDLIISIMVRKSTFGKAFWSLLNKDNLLSVFFKNALNPENEKNYLLFQTDNSPILQTYMQNLMSEFNTKDSFCNNSMNCIFVLFLTTVLRNYKNSMRFYNLDGLAEKKFDTNLFLQYLYQNYNTVTLQTLSDMFHYSESFFSKLIKNRFGKTFSQLIRELRLSHARELLRDTNDSLQQICDIVGYNSVSAFSRAYKAMYGESPSSNRSPADQTT